MRQPALRHHVTGKVESENVPGAPIAPRLPNLARPTSWDHSRKSTALRAVCTVPALIIEPFSVFVCEGKPRELLRLLCFYPQHFLTQVVQYLAMLLYSAPSIIKSPFSWSPRMGARFVVRSGRAQPKPPLLSGPHALPTCGISVSLQVGHAASALDLNMLVARAGRCRAASFLMLHGF
jgi:hypothetical protein